MFKLTLSVSKTQIKTKTEGTLVTEFLTQEFDVNNDTNLKELFTTRLYSTNYWESGKCSKRNFSGLYGITVDIDNGKSIDAAKEIFKNYNYIIHTSTSHRADLEKKGGIQDRFRIILPGNPDKYPKFKDLSKASALYALIIKKYPFVDSACAEPARKYFPFLNTTYPQLLEIHINDTGLYYEVDDGELVDMLIQMEAARKLHKNKNAVLGDPNRKYITWETEVVLKDKITKVRIRDIEEATHSIYCPFCDDINSAGPSAHITFNIERFPILVCDHCKSVHEGNEGKYYLPLSEKYNNLLYIEDKLYCIKETQKSINLVKMPIAYINHLAPDDSRRLQNWLSKNRLFAAEDFKLQKLYNGYTEKLNWSYVDGGTTLEINVPPVPVQIQDNDYINNWINSMIIEPEYNEFFKDYLAVFAYHNHGKVPVLVLTGPRGSGKTTVAEFMSNFFRDCHADWDGNNSQFTSYFEKRLLLVDEAINNKKEQYVKLKAITGRSDLRVNKKHKAEYQVANNVCVVLLTNESVPMYLIEHECPTEASENQFFMYHLEKRKGPMNAMIGTELKERAGHYIRTELRRRYEAWRSRGDLRNNRYAIPVPITDLLRSQFENSRTALDYECDQVFLACINGVVRKDRMGQPIETIGPFDTVSTADLRHLIDAVGVTNSNVKSFRERMQQYGYLKLKRTHKNGLDAWEIDPGGLIKLQKQKGT